MKPSQLAMLEDLQKCWMTKRDTRTFTDALFRGNVWSAMTFRWLWNRYRNQIRHNRKVKK